MALTLLEAAKRTPNKLMAGLALEIVRTDELAAMIPFATFMGQAITYIREGTPASTGFIPDSGLMGAASSSTDDHVSVPARRIGSDLYVDSLADDLTGGQSMGDQVSRKAKATWMLVGDKLVTGGNTTSHALSLATDPFAAIDAIQYGPGLDSSRFGPGEIKYTHVGTLWQFRAPGDPTYGDAVAAAADGSYTLYSFNKSRWIRVTLDVSDATQNGRTIIEFASSNDEFDGINRLCSADMVIPSVGADGDAFSFNVLDELMRIEKVRSNRAFFMHGKVVNKYLALSRTLGGASPDHVRLPGYSGLTPTYRGVPILTNDSIPLTEAKGAASTLSSVYLASLSAEEGLALGVPGTGNQSLDVFGDPRRSVTLGWKIESLGTSTTHAQRGTRVQWYGAPFIRSSRALARAKEIITA